MARLHDTPLDAAAVLAFRDFCLVAKLRISLIWFCARGPSARGQGNPSPPLPAGAWARRPASACCNHWFQGVRGRIPDWFSLPGRFPAHGLVEREHRSWFWECALISSQQRAKTAAASAPRAGRRS